MQTTAGGPLEISDDELGTELLALVEEGLLFMSVRNDGEMVFWPTTEGIKALGMTA